MYFVAIYDTLFKFIKGYLQYPSNRAAVTYLLNNAEVEINTQDKSGDSGRQNLIGTLYMYVY